MNRRLIVNLLVGLIAAGCATTSQTFHPAYPDSPRVVGGRATIAFVSDTQSPLWFEKVLLASDDNEQATQHIFQKISRDTTCAALFHLGDITGAGSEDNQWERFDAKALVLRQANIPIYPALGNHEYLFSAEAGTYNAMLRFPLLRKQWYAKRIGSTAILLLNSNFSKLSGEEIHRQQEWYGQMIDSLDADTAISVVLVGCHHPPYTNSTVVDPSEEVQQNFVPPFMKSKKAKIFLSGHSHAFEHFNMGNKDFLVIGGGGGLLHPLLEDNKLRWRDHFSSDDRRRFFHYVNIDPRSDAIGVEVLAVTSDNEKSKSVYVLTIPYAQK